VLLLGMGGGGDVVGALALTEPLGEQGSEWVLGGVAWERSPIDPRPGPRSLAELRGGRPCGSVALLDSGDTVTLDGVALSESRMAAHLGRPTLLLDVTRGPRALATGLREAADELDCDRILMLDVGGDVLAHGDEPGLASPLCDAVMLAAALELGDVLLGVYGAGCDGELTPLEVLQRTGELGGDGALLGAWELTPSASELVEAAAEVVPTEASLQAVRCARGERGIATIRSGRRTVELTPLGALTVLFDPARAGKSAFPLARAVRDANSIEDAHEALAAIGVRSELALERARARGESAAGAPE
jgi:hypothetical protein